MEVQLPAGRNTGTAQIFWVPPIISETGKATNFKFGRYVHRVHPNKSPLKIWEKRECGHIQGLPKFFEYPLLSREQVKLRFCTHILSIDRNKSPLQISRKVAGCVVRTLETFQGTHILGASCGLLCDSSAVLLDEDLISYYYLSCSCWATSSKKVCHFKSDRIEIWQACSSGKYAYRLTESDSCRNVLPPGDCRQTQRAGCLCSTIASDSSWSISYLFSQYLRMTFKGHCALYMHTHAWQSSTVWMRGADSEFTCISLNTFDSTI